MFTAPSEQPRRFGAEVAHFLLPSVEQAGDVLGFGLFLLRLELLLLSGGQALLADTLGFEVFEHFGEIALRKVGDLCLV